MKYTKFFILLFMLSITALISGCTEQQVQKKYPDFMQKYQKGVVVVYFYDNNCRACNIQNAEIDAAKKEIPFRIIKVRPNNATIAKYNLKAFPTILIFNNGKVAKRYEEVTYKNQLLTELDFFINDANDEL